MNIVVWWNIPCKAITGVFNELSKIKDVNLILITGQLNTNRIEMGWEDNNINAINYISLKDDEWEIKGKIILEKYSEYLHVFNGFYYPKRMNNLISLAIKKNIQFGIFTEAPSNNSRGFKQLAKNIYHNYILPIRAYKIAKSSCFVFCLSGSDSLEHRKLQRLGWKKEKIIPFGYFSEDIYNISHRNANFTPEIFCPGNLVPHKAVDILIKALKVVEEQNIEFKCHITGQGPEKEKLMQLTKKLGLDDKVTFHGVLNQVDFNDLQKKMDILVAPGIIEPWGIRINEAIQCGQVVIVSDRIGAKELIMSSGGGNVFQSGNYVDLSNKLLPYLKYNNQLQNGQIMNLKYKIKIDPKNICLYVFKILNTLKTQISRPAQTWL